jgi:hypothetical protein
MTEKQMIIDKLEKIVNDVDLLQRVDVKKWGFGLQSGKLGFQSGNTDLIYIINKENRLARIDYRSYSFDKITTEPIGYLEDYFLKRKNHLYFLTDLNNIKSKPLKKYIYNNIKNFLSKISTTFEKSLLKDFDENLV